jgi:hypothetical protein
VRLTAALGGIACRIGGLGLGRGHRRASQADGAAVPSRTWPSGPDISMITP